MSTTVEQFVAIAHRVVWCTLATVDRHNRPRSRIVHPVLARGERTAVWQAEPLGQGARG